MIRGGSALDPVMRAVLYSTTGQSDYVLTIMAQDIEAYEHILMNTLFKLPAVAHVRSSIVLRDIKQGAGLPL